MPLRLPIVRQAYVAGVVLLVVGSVGPPLYAGAFQVEPSLAYAALTEPTLVTRYGVVVAVVLCSVAANAAWRPAREFTSPTLLLLLTAVGAFLLLARPGLGGPSPELGVGAWTLLTAAAVLAAAALVDVLHIPSTGRDARRRPVVLGEDPVDDR